MIAADVEPIAAGLLLIVSPSLFSWLVWGAQLSEVGQVLGRLGGIVLLALGAACWSSPVMANYTTSAVRALLAYHLLVAVYLFYVGASSSLVGVLLWPAVLLHVTLGMLVVWVWLAPEKS